MIEDDRTVLSDIDVLRPQAASLESEAQNLAMGDEGQGPDEDSTHPEYTGLGERLQNLDDRG